MSETAKAAELKREEEVEERHANTPEPKRIENARGWLKWFIKTEDLEFTAVARRLGLSESGGRNLVSKFYHDKLGEADPTRIVLAVENLRANIEGPEGISAFIGFRETRSVVQLWRHAKAAREGHFIGMIVGPTGFGKTEALREFQRRTRNDGKAPVEYIYCRISTNLPALIIEVAETVGLIERGKGGDAARLHRFIAQSLRSRPRFLIFDEAECLNERCLTFIRNLHDESGGGSLVVGRPPLLETIRTGVKWTSSNGEGDGRVIADGPLAPFIDRVFSLVIPGLSDEEAVKITEEVLKGRLTEKAVSKLLFYVGPNFRLLSKMIGALRDIRIKAGRTIDHMVIETAWLRVQKLNFKP